MDPDGPRDAAFGATPGADVFAAVSDTEEGAGADAGGGAGESATGGPVVAPRARWLAAVTLGGQGHYAAAAAVLRGLLAHPRPLWASLAASTLASHRRQLGAHAAARPLDAMALRKAAEAEGSGAPPDRDGVDAAGARCDALVGLAADALGLGRLAAAERLLSAASAGHGATGSWRSAVRLSWVRAELELASGRPDAAIGPARDAVQRSGGGVRHTAKSRLVLAAALAASGHRDEPDELLHELVVDLARHGQVPLRWAAELVLADLHIGTEHGAAHRGVALRALRVALRRADVPLRTAAESSLWVPSGVLQSGDSAERSSAGEIHDEICTGLCQVSTPRDR